MKRGSRAPASSATSVVSHLDFDFAADAIAFSPTGGFVALADNAHRRIAIHSLVTKARLAELPSGAVPILSLTFGKNPSRSADPLARHLLAAGDTGGTAVIWDLRNRMPRSHCRGLPREVAALAFHPDGILLATGGREEVQIWEVTTGRACLRIRPPQGIDYITQLAFSPDGAQLAVASRGIYNPPSTAIWNLSNGRGVARLMGLSGQIDAIVVSPDGKTAAALAQNWELGVWDLESGRLKFALDVPAGEFADNAGLTFGADNRTLAYSVGTLREGVAVMIDAADGREVRRWKLPPGLQNRFGFDAAGRLWHFQVELESGAGLPTSEWVPWEKYPRVGRLRNLFGAEPERALSEFRGCPRHVHRAGMTPDGKYTLLEGSAATSRVTVIENATGAVVADHPAAHGARASSLMIDSSGARAQFTDLHSAEISEFAIPHGPLRTTPGTPVQAGNAAAGYESRHVHGPTHGCFLYGPNGVEPLVGFAPGVRINASAFDAKGRRLLGGGRDGAVMAADIPAVQKRLEPLGYAW